MLAILAAVVLAAAPQPRDTVYTADGGRLLGTVLEESPQAVVIQLPDGATRRLPPRDVSRIEYADGSISTPNRPAPPPPAYAPAPPAYPPAPPQAQPPAYGPPPPYAPPPPTYAPPPPTYAARPAPPPRPPPGALVDAGGGMPPILPLYATFGLGGAFLSGEAEDGVRMSRVFGSQLDVWLEGGVRLTPHLALALYVDAGVGEPAREIRDLYGCSAVDVDCTATTARVGLLLRHTFQPRARSTPWIAAGTGFEFGSVTVDDRLFRTSEEAFEYAGWEALRLMAGVDLRSNPVFGVGLYAGVAFGRYSRFEDAFGEVDIGRQPFHSTVSAGVRFTLFP